MAVARGQYYAALDRPGIANFKDCEHISKSKVIPLKRWVVVPADNQNRIQYY